MSNPVINCLVNHRSVRKYTKQPIDDETRELMVTNLGLAGFDLTSHQ
jgi:nitroreductase